MNIPTSLIVVLLVVAWLVVLVPMVARRREKVPQAESDRLRFSGAASAHRHHYAGDLIAARKDHVTTTRTVQSESADTEVTGDRRGAPDAGSTPATTRRRRGMGRPPKPRIGRPGIGAQRRRRTPSPSSTSSRTTSTIGPPKIQVPSMTRITGRRRSGSFGSIEGATPDRRRPGHPGRRSLGARPARPSPDEVNEEEWAEHVAAAPAGRRSLEVDDEQLRPVPQRRGRGGFDPEAAEATRAFRYQQRRRITLILLIATVAFSVAAALIVSWLWVGAVVSLALLVGYLATCVGRSASRPPSGRSGWNGCNARGRSGPNPRARSAGPQGGMSAVAPGRTVVDLEDDDPGFDDLDEYREHVTYRRAAGQ